MDMFEKIETDLAGCYLLRPRRFVDSRGTFVKCFQVPAFDDLGLESGMMETFWSSSYRNVIRGLHYQKPPHDHAKLVSCLRGEVFDVVVDLRVESPTFGKHVAFTLKASDALGVYIARGMAHGFQAIENEALLLYLTSSSHQPEADSGIRWDSCGISWPAVPIVSLRDASLPTIDEYRQAPDFRCETVHRTQRQ